MNNKGQTKILISVIVGLLILGGIGFFIFDKLTTTEVIPVSILNQCSNYDENCVLEIYDKEKPCTDFAGGGFFGGDFRKSFCIKDDPNSVAVRCTFPEDSEGNSLGTDFDVLRKDFPNIEECKI
tara:strand:- start:2704 stop:3075 length:372 start_codon:yes stop_codon:yes gene_type:complete